MIALSVKKPRQKPRVRYIAVRMKSDLADKIEDFAETTNRSRSEIINQLLTAMIKHTHVVPDKEK